MKKKLIFLHPIKFPRIFTKNYQLLFLQKNFDIELHQFCNFDKQNEIFNNFFVNKEEEKKFNIKTFRTVTLWKRYIQILINKEKKKGTKLEIINVAHSYNSFKYLFVLKFLIDKRINFAMFKNPSIPTYEISSNVVKLKYNIFRLILMFLRKIKKFYKLSIKVILIKKIEFILNIEPNKIFVAGEFYKKSLIKKFSSSKFEIIDFNSVDYSNFINFKKKKKKKIKYKYAVFIAEPGPTNFNDFVYMGLKYDLESDVIYEKNCNFFRSIEKNSNLKVIIASHPKSENDKYLYPKFLIVKNNIIELVKNCEFVITYCSTAISYAVIFKKPIIFITNKFRKLNQKYFKFDRFLASCFNSTPTDIAENFDNKKFKKFFKVNNRLYENYLKDYLSSNKNLSNAEIITKHLK